MSTTKITVFGRSLTANKQERTISGLMLPFNEIGYTSAGRLTVGPGAINIPDVAASVHLNLEHDQLRPVGKGISFEEKDDGIHATFRVANTTAGNDLLTEVEEELRASLSVEVSEPVIRDGVLVGGDLTGCGAVVNPAFPSASIYNVTASDCGGELKVSTDQKGNTMGTLPENGAPEVPGVPPVAPVITAGDSRQEIGNIMHAAFNAGGAPAMNSVMSAALADLTPSDDAGKLYVGDQKVGELWKAYLSQRPLVETIGVKPLTSLTVAGQTKTRTFVVGNWAGGKVELPTAEFTTTPATWTASAKAVAVDVAAELIEFGGEQVLSDLYQQAIESYINQTEADLITYLIAQAGAGTVNTSALSAINAAADLLGSIGANMDFIAVAPNVMGFLRNITTANSPWWLASQSNVDLRTRTINLGGLTLTQNSALAAGNILVGDKRAVDYRESRDLKFKALDVAHGGVDISFIKFRAQKVTDTAGLVRFTGVTGA